MQNVKLRCSLGGRSRKLWLPSPWALLCIPPGPPGSWRPLAHAAPLLLPPVTTGPVPGPLPLAKFACYRCWNSRALLGTTGDVRSLSVERGARSIIILGQREQQPPAFPGRSARVVCCPHNTAGPTVISTTTTTDRPACRSPGRWHLVSGVHSLRRLWPTTRWFGGHSRKLVL